MHENRRIKTIFWQRAPLEVIGHRNAVENCVILEYFNNRPLAHTLCFFQIFSCFHHYAAYTHVQKIKLQGTIPRGIITWSALGKQNVQEKELRVEQYSDTPTVDRYTTDNQLQHIGRHVGRHSRPICRPTGSRHVDRVSADMSTDLSVDTWPTYRPRVSTDRGLYYTWS